MLVEIVHVRVNPNLAEQVNWLESGLLPDRSYPNSLQNARYFPAIQQNGIDYVRPSRPNWLLRTQVVERDVESVRLLVVVWRARGQDVMVGEEETGHITVPGCFF